MATLQTGATLPAVFLWKSTFFPNDNELFPILTFQRKITVATSGLHERRSPMTLNVRSKNLPFAIARTHDGVTGSPLWRIAARLLALCFAVALFPGFSSAQRTDSGPAPSPIAVSPVELAKQVAELRAMVLQLQAQMKELQAAQPPIVQASAAVPAPAVYPSSSLPVTVSSTNSQPLETQIPATPAPSPEQNLLQGTTVNFLVDSYYAYNFNDPIGRANYLRAYDVLSNAFSLNQADIVLENAADPANGKRFGARLDLQFGQATQTLQGNTVNEPRPEIYRNIFQAYGTYVAALGSGLVIDFGKWSSSLGIEGNYTQDQMNYSRSYWFDFLPFYHMGARVHYQFNDQFGANYWITNGTNQIEPFNGYKDELFGLVITPAKTLNWTVNYYLGQEHPDFQFVPNGSSNLPTLQGTPFAPIVDPLNGKTHILDTYATWKVTPKLTLAGEADYVIERLRTSSAPSETRGGAAYIRYQFTPKIALASRGEWLFDHGGLYSGKTQTLNETTITFEYRFSNGFLMREEWRRDWSSQPFFLTSTLGILKTYQNTATLGLVWWFGGKQGPW